jgi:hypothetical protein
MNTPLPSYYVPFYEAILVNKFHKMNDRNDSYAVNTHATFYDRSAFQVYNHCGNTENLSALFHGQDKFLLGDIFSDPTTEFKNFLTDRAVDLNSIVINPHYSLHESGCIVGLNIIKNIDFFSRDYQLRLNARVPIKKIKITHDKKYQSINAQVIGNLSAQVNGWFNQRYENGKSVFAARLDKLYEKGIIQLSNVDKNYFVINPTLLPGTVDSNNYGNPSISLQSAVNGKVLFSTWLGNTIDSAQSYDVDNNTVIRLGSPFNVLLNSASPNNLSVVLPLMLLGYEGYQPMFLTEKTLDSSPILQTRTIARSQSYYTDYSEPRIKGYLNTGDSVFIANDILSTNGFIGYYNPGVVVQQSHKGFPSVYGREVSLPYQNSLNGLYETTYESDLVNNNIVQIVNSDGTITAPNSGLPAIFWYKNDYSNLFNESNKDNIDSLYLTTAFGVDNNPTLDSYIMQKAINDSLNNVTLDTSSQAIDLTKKMIQGWYKNQSVGDQYSNNGEFLNAWEDYQSEGVADLDLEILLGSTWNNNFVADVIVGMIFPTSKTLDNCYNRYCSLPLGANGHYEIRLGTQLAYVANSWIRLNGYVHYAITLDKEDRMFSAFSNTSSSLKKNIFGLQPSYMYGNVSWNTLIGALDCTLFANSECALSLKYQYMFKSKDCIDLLTQKSIDALGNIYPVDISSMRDYSERQSHKVGFNICGIIAQDMKLILGMSNVIYGKNIPHEKDYFLTVIVDF